jgi:inorganic phosphate transporter, PiT family
VLAAVLLFLATLFVAYANGANDNFGLPVSTTHVAVGAISGIGLANGSADKGVMGGILASWLLTLPVVAVIGALVYALPGFFPLS